jgi:hypothetical protein
MNCEALRDRLLAAHRPDRPGSVARRHLASCHACRTWHSRLLALESDLPRLYVPPALDAKAALLHAVRRGAEQPDGVVRLSRPTSTTPKERGLRKLAVAMALAAGLALFAVGWALWPHSDSIVTPTDPLASRHAERDHRLAGARSPRERVEAIANLSEEVRREALVQNDTAQLALLIRFYTQLVHDDLPALARVLPEEERVAVINQMTTQLTLAESETDRLASEPGHHHHAQELLALAAVARDGQGRLRALL